MLIRQMFDKILLDSGQFTMAIENIELNEDRFAILVRSVIGEYNKYCPCLKTFNIVTYDKYFTFVEGYLGLGIPDWVSDVRPVRILGIFPYYLNSVSPSGDMRQTRNPEIDDKTQYPWTYRAPRLYLPIAGTYDCDCVYKHKVVQVQDENGKTVYDVPTIDYDRDEFFKLLLGHFMVALARNRRAFTMGDIPIQSDADTLAGEGTDTIQNARENLIENNSMFYLAWS